MNVFFEIEHEANVQVHHRRKEMSEDLRKQVYQALLARSNNGILHKKDTQIIADRFDLHLRTVQRIWRRGKTQLANSVPVVVSIVLKRVELVLRQFLLIWKPCVTFL
jgi:hypothetical protein